MEDLIIAIDGPAGAGKSTIAKIISEKLNITYIDTGAMYRALTYKVLKNNINLKDKDKIVKLLNNTTIDFNDSHIYLDGKIVDSEIRENNISQNVSLVAKIKDVRLKLVEIQRKISENKSVVMDGRDIGSYVLPNANYKFYITATPEERGRRRYNELTKKQKKVNLNEIISDIKKRDKTDSTREIAPLIKTKDAILIDTTNKSIEEGVKEVLSYII